MLFVATATLGMAVCGHAFQAEWQGRLAFTYMKGQTMAIHMSQGVGKTSRAYPASKDAVPIHPALSPDGKRLAYAMIESNDPADSAHLYAANLDGKDLKMLAVNGSLPAWSPDASRIAFTLDNSPPSIATVSADGSGMKQLPVRRPYALAPCWSADGKRIAYTGSDQPNPRVADLYIINADGTGDQLFTGGGKMYLGGSGAWSPDGTSIVLFAIDPVARKGELQIWDVATKKPRTIMELTSALSQGAAALTSKNAIPMACWAPDGSSLAVTMLGQKGKRVDLGVYQVTPEGQVLRRMTPEDVPCFGASWSK